MLISSLVHARFVLWRDNAAWELVLFIKLWYILGENSVICSLKDSTQLESIKSNDKTKGKRNKQE